MRHLTPKGICIAVAAAVVLAPLSAANASPTAGSDSADDTITLTSGRQQVFHDAAAKYGVPESVLLAVSYLESRWNANGGQPSVGAGYGPMHLTDVDSVTVGGDEAGDGTGDARGDEARPMDIDPARPVPAGASLRTLELAATLTDQAESSLRSDPSANILGCAALLAHYQKSASSDPADWYGAVARYSGAGDAAGARQFADQVYAQLRTGASRVTDDGERVTLEPTVVRPQRSQLDDLGLQASDTSDVECPDELGCQSIPAPYVKFSDEEGDYGNHDLAERPNDEKVNYILIHDTEATWDTTLKLVQDPHYVSWHYSIRSNDGQIAQHVPTRDVAWHAGNWYVNSHSIGIEHEGFAAQGTWYTEAMYRTSAKLVTYLAAKYDIPIDRAHIIGHDNVPGITPSRVAAMHWDPGPYWDWGHYFALLGKPFKATGTSAAKLVTIRTDYATNKLVFTGCDPANPSAPCPARSSTTSILHTQPSDDAPLLNDIALRPDGTPDTMGISDIGSRVDTGNRYAVADVQGDWIAIWYLGQKGWLHKSDTVWATGLVVTPKAGKTSVPVYGRAYPEASAYPSGVPVQSIVPLQYAMPAGQRYTLGQLPWTDYYHATTYDYAGHTVVRGKDRYYQVQFGHRFMYVRAADVDLIPSGA